MAALVGLALAGAAALDWLGVPARVTPPAVSPPQAEAAFVSEGSYCPLPGDEEVTSVLATANPSGGPTHLRRWGIGSSQASPAHESALGPGRRTAASLSDLGARGGAGVVESFGAPSVADALVTSPDRGVASSPCTDQPWTRWLFATASTRRGYQVFLLALNPFEEEAVLRVRLLLPDADLVPARLKDLVIPPTSQATVFLADYYPETDSFGLEVTATRGRVVVSRYARISTREGLRGLDLDLGAREEATRWYFAGGQVPAEGNEEIVLINPGGREALIQLVLQTDEEQLTAPALQEIPLPAGRQVKVNVGEYLGRGVRHGVLVLSANGVPFVAERRVVAEMGGSRSLDSSFGAPSTGRRWAVAAGSHLGGGTLLAIVNEGRTRTSASVALLTDSGERRPGELASVALPPGLARTIDLAPFLAGGAATAVVEAAGEVVVEGLLTLGEPFRDFDFSPGQLLR
ncbi:MAG: DUF5719 family protein [Acidimicrobiales bacterium]